MDSAPPADPANAPCLWDKPDPYGIASLEQLAEHYAAPSELVLNKVIDWLEPMTCAFIAASPFCVLATTGSKGVHASPRGDGPGFVRVLDHKTLALPDRRGNNRLDGLRDLMENQELALLFLVPGATEALRVNGVGRLTTDPALCAGFIEQGKVPTSVLLVKVTEIYMQCGKAAMRSHIWADRPRPEGLPSTGKLFAAHTRGRADAATTDAEMPARLKATMY